MNALIEKQVKKAKIFRIVTCIFIGLFLGSYVLFNFWEPGQVMLLLMPSMLIAFIDLFVYIGRYRPLLCSMKQLTPDQLHLLNDIPTDQPTLPRSKIYCGSKAMYTKKPHVVIPYSQFAWVYRYERRSYGMTVEKAMIVHTKDGRKISLGADDSEFIYLLENYVAPHSPDLIMGYGSAERKRYLERNPAAMAADRRSKIIWGSVLLVIAALLLVLSLLEPPFNLAHAILIAIPAIPGAVMLFLGLRK